MKKKESKGLCGYLGKKHKWSEAKINTCVKKAKANRGKKKKLGGSFFIDDSKSRKQKVTVDDDYMTNDDAMIRTTNEKRDAI